MIIQSGSPRSHKPDPEDSLAQIAPALRELAAGVKSVPAELKSEIQAVDKASTLAYGRGLTDGSLAGALGVLVLFALAMIWKRAS